MTLTEARTKNLEIIHKAIDKVLEKGPQYVVCKETLSTRLRRLTRIVLYGIGPTPGANMSSKPRCVKRHTKDHRQSCFQTTPTGLVEHTGRYEVILKGEGTTRQRMYLED